MTKSGPELTEPAPIDVALICYPGSQATCIHGVTDLFTYADHFARRQSSASRTFVRITHWRPAAAGGRLECVFDSRPGPFGTPTVVVVPASQFAPIARGHSPESTAWLASRHAEGAIVAAVCGGVFVLADSGLLAGRRATTHWMFADELQRRHPELTIEADRLVIDDGDIVTAGGVLAWADMGLSLIERLLGTAVMRATARFMLIDPPGREQRYYSDFTPHLRHGDKAVLAAQHWLQAHAPAPLSLAVLAGHAGLGTRTLLRRFVKATGLTPSEYHQRLRIARSRELLECTRDPIDRVAAAAGYEDSGGFRRSFKRLVGLSPGEYRRRFQGKRRPQSPAD